MQFQTHLAQKGTASPATAATQHKPKPEDIVIHEGMLQDLRNVTDPIERARMVKAIIKDQGGVTPAAQRMYLPPLTLRDEDEVGSYEGIDSRVINVFEERD